jgi:hypothetical protein
LLLGQPTAGAHRADVSGVTWWPNSYPYFLSTPAFGPIQQKVIRGLKRKSILG